MLDRARAAGDPALILLTALAVEPLGVLALLAVPRTHDLVRSLDPASPLAAPAVSLSGPAFWVHLVDVNVLMVGSVVGRDQPAAALAALPGRAWALVGAGVLPFAVNLGYNLGVGPLSRVDLTLDARPR